MKEKKTRKPSKTDLDVSIEQFLKKNRVFSKIVQSKLEESKYDFILKKLGELDSNKSVKYIIIQDVIVENKLERFMYTNDNYTFIINDDELFLKLKDYNYSIYKNIDVSFLDTTSGLYKNR